MSSARFLLAVVVGLLALAGCLGRSASPAFYTLTPLARADAAAPADGPALGVGPAHLPGYLERPQIVTRRDNRLAYDELQRWAGSLESELLRVLGANLAQLLATDRVAVYPAEPRFPIAFRVVLELERFDGVLGDEVTLQVRWVLASGKGGKLLATGNSTIREPVASRRYQDLVAAHSAAIATLSREIADRIRSLAQ